MTYPAVFIFDFDKFIALFPEFTGTDTDVAQSWWDRGTNTISDVNYGWMNDASRQNALYYMTAHFGYVTSLIAKGMTTVLIKGANVDKVNVTLEPPKTSSAFTWWLSTSPYGLELRQMLAQKSTGGFVVGGSPQTPAFRSFKGNFGRLW